MECAGIVVVVAGPDAPCHAGIRQIVADDILSDGRSDRHDERMLVGLLLSTGGSSLAVHTGYGSPQSWFVGLRCTVILLLIHRDAGISPVAICAARTNPADRRRPLPR